MVNKDSIHHFDNPSIRGNGTGGFASPGCPGFASSMVLPVYEIIDLLLKMTLFKAIPVPNRFKMKLSI